MKLDLCLLSCDLNPDYYLFFPFVRKMWKEIVGIDCILILVGNEIPHPLLPEKEHIIMFPPIPDIPTGFQAQCIRILYPCLLKNNYNGIIISDMDMIPLDRDFFLQVEKHNPNDFVIYRDVISEYRQYPICYCVASSQTWTDIFNIHIMNDLRTKLESWYTKNDYKISSPASEMWAQDQLKLYEAINLYEITTKLSEMPSFARKIVRLYDEDTKFSRLDRANIEYISNHVDDVKKDIINHKYSDFHLPRPYDKYKNLLHSLFYFR